eukprot:Gb_20017 [translate_table: standard]
MLTNTIWPVIGPQHCVASPIQLTMQRTGFWGTNRIIRDPVENTIFTVEGHACSLNSKRVLVDAAGNGLVTMKSKSGSCRRRWEVFGHNSEAGQSLLLSVRQASIWQSRMNLNVYLASNTDEKQSDFHIKCSFMERTVKVYSGDTVIAEAKRKTKFIGRDRIEMNVHEGLDQAFIVVLMVIMDENISARNAATSTNAASSGGGVG